MDKSVRIGKGHHLGAQPHSLLSCVLGYVSGAGHEHRLSFEGLALQRQHLLSEVAHAVTGGLGAQTAAAPGYSLACEGAGELVTQALVLSEKITYLPSAYAYIAGRNVGIRTYMPLKLGHKALAETHHLRVGFAPRAEIGTSFTASHRKGREGVLEGLLESKELHDAEVYAGVEADTALVRAQGAVHLNPVSAIYVDLSPVVSPRYTEHYDTFRLYHSVENFQIHKVRVRSHIRSNALNDFSDCLVELALTGIAGDKLRHEPIDVVGCKFVHEV